MPKQLTDARHREKESSAMPGWQNLFQIAPAPAVSPLFWKTGWDRLPVLRIAWPALPQAPGPVNHSQERMYKKNLHICWGPWANLFKAEWTTKFEIAGIFNGENGYSETACSQSANHILPLLKQWFDTLIMTIPGLRLLSRQLCPQKLSCLAVALIIVSDLHPPCRSSLHGGCFWCLVCFPLSALISPKPKLSSRTMMLKSEELWISVPSFFVAHIQIMLAEGYFEGQSAPDKVDSFQQAIQAC